MRRAIDTAYAGCLFRSRLEARWAVFMDTLGVPWQYEPEAFALEHGAYLPDFYLSQLLSRGREQDAWLEVKGRHPTEHEQELAAELATTTGSRVFIAYGDIPRDANRPHANDESMELLFPAGGWDSCYAWCACSRCGAVGIEYSSNAHERLCDEKECYAPDYARLDRAYQAARSYRFEPTRCAR